MKNKDLLTIAAALAIGYYLGQQKGSQVVTTPPVNPPVDSSTTVTPINQQGTSLGYVQRMQLRTGWGRNRTNV